MEFTNHDLEVIKEVLDLTKNKHKLLYIKIVSMQAEKLAKDVKDFTNKYEM